MPRKDLGLVSLLIPLARSMRSRNSFVNEGRVAINMLVKSYDLYIDLDFKASRFDGKVTIDLESDQDVTLNSLALEILKIESEGAPFSYKQEGEDLVVKTGPFSGLLEIEYRGTISEQLVGLYKVPYDGTHIVSSQLAAAHARNMFPCIDHPEYKAEFRITVRADRDLSIISNMPAESVRPEGEKQVVTFQKTPRMSTYLLYLGAGRLDEAKDEPASLVLAATTPGKTAKTKFARDVAVKSLKFYESYFGSPYQLPKLHLIAVPEFWAGAMENWGAITFREIALFVDDNTRVRTIRRVAYIVAHEVAHQWFGNLVTMKWWDDIWLNESFATFMGYKVVDTLFPEWKIWHDFLRLDTSGALSRDSLNSTHPIEVPVSQPSEIEQIFDEISYGKGASILRMLEAYIGADNFKAGVRTYLESFKFSNATGRDLWDHLEASSRVGVKRIMNDWITMPGYPMITVSKEDKKLKLSQERFMLTKAAPGIQEQSIWPVPLTISINGKPRTLLMESREAELNLPEDLQSLKLNADQTGFYRVYYDGMYEQLWNSELSALDRFGIISDAYAFALAGKMPFREYLALAARYFGEEEHLPAYEVSNQLALLYSISPAIKETSRKFHKSQLEILRGRTDENSAVLNGVVADRLAMVDIDYAEDLAKSFQDYEKVDPNMRQAVGTAYARATGDLDGLIQKYRASATDDERAVLLSALVSFAQSHRISEALDLATSGEVKKQDVWYMPFYSIKNPSSRDTMWTWLTANMTWLRKLYEGTPTLSYLLGEFIPFVGIGRVQEVESYFINNKLPEADKGVETGLEKLKLYDGFARHVEAV